MAKNSRKKAKATSIGRELLSGSRNVKIIVTGLPRKENLAKFLSSSRAPKLFFFTDRKTIPAVTIIGIIKEKGDRRLRR
jgi:hypothetical protein